jgi:hypothetical protein
LLLFARAFRWTFPKAPAKASAHARRPPRQPEEPVVLRPRFSVRAISAAAISATALTKGEGAALIYDENLQPKQAYTVLQ